MGVRISNGYITINKDIHTGPICDWVVCDNSVTGLPLSYDNNFQYINGYYIMDDVSDNQMIYYCQALNGTWLSSTLPSNRSHSPVVFYQGKNYKFASGYMYTSTNLVSWTQTTNSSSRSWNQLYVAGDGRLVAGNSGYTGYTAIGGTSFTVDNHDDITTSLGYLLMDNTRKNFNVYPLNNNYYRVSTDFGVTWTTSSEKLGFGMMQCGGAVDGTNTIYLAPDSESYLHAYKTTYDNSVKQDIHVKYPVDADSTDTVVAYGQGIVLAMTETNRSDNIEPGGTIHLVFYLNYGINDKELRRYEVDLVNTTSNTLYGNWHSLFFLNDRFVLYRGGLLAYSLPIGRDTYNSGDGELVDGFPI